MAGSYVTFNGWNIIPAPSSPAFKGVKFSIVDNVSISQSPFTMQQQVQKWPGADYWAAEVTLPPMLRSVASPWLSFLMALRGQANVCQIGDQLATTPQGTATGTPTVSGAHLACSTILNTTGWTHSLPAVLYPGDYIQIGYRLYMVVGTSAYSSDGSGLSQVEIWPSLRDALNGGESIIVSNTKGLFRLADPKREWDVTDAKTYGISFKLMEAR